MLTNVTQGNVSENTEVVRVSVAEINIMMVTVQVMAGVCLSVNCLLVFTFFRKEAFRTNTRYILFAQALCMDSVMLVLTDFAFLLFYFYIPLPAAACIVLCMLMEILTYTTPLTLTAMCLERYVAICMPLRHADISTARTRLGVILIIWALGSIPPLIDFFILLSSKAQRFYTEKQMCSYEMLFQKQWQSYLRSALSQFYFLVIAFIIGFVYIQIVSAATAASANNKSSTYKARKTIILHACQLLLSLIPLICPFVENSIFEIDLRAYINLRYLDFVAFTIAPRCLSPLVYGLRDEKFFLVLKYYAICGLNKKISPIV